MKPNNIITLTAFLTALTQLDEPLPDNIQTQLNDISKALIANPDNIGNLDAIAESYPPLDKVYQIELTRIEKTGERTKGLPPLPLPTEPTAELTNAAFNAFSNNNSVAAAKIAVKPNLLQRVRDFINGRIGND
ncbi:MAG: hypothetical protein RM347_012050 [Nostoc sp. ChiQUE02]|uniref:hypothetical protein n=1 Tax=Nostoc sp. ChiQUE02 TaxID=3075377 RepID=UPI002AD25134|nr:hypothetical protein [Nostoc sp. ChiQUE02]MDZ8229368.1 hypothetical protein [Nostoc sp. ChiQUE02]